MALVTALPVVFTWEFWRQLRHATFPRSWDGSGHYAIAEIYARTTFPDVFGWTHAYFGGMPFPNFYPPLFYWCVGLLTSTGLLSFDACFKALLAASILLLPAAVWALARTISGGNRVVATCAALSILPLLSDVRFIPTSGPSGLDYFSTFAVGLYTQPLGFVLLAFWYATYAGARLGRARFALATLLLALTVLANFFNCVTATVFVASVLADDALNLLRCKGSAERDDAKRRLFKHAASPLIAACLTAFWVVPMLTEFGYFVTRPVKVASLFEAIPLGIWVWYVFAQFGMVCWFRRSPRGMRPFVMTCAALGLLVVFDATVAPSWFPLQSTRFLATLNFLLAVPAGYALATVYDAASALIDKLLGRRVDAAPHGNRFGLHAAALRRALLACAAAALLLSVFGLTEPGYFGFAFYNTETAGSVESVLRFARGHGGGRYMVEIPPYPTPQIRSLDSRSITSRLGAQGNESLSVVFREASPSSIFFNPLISVFSGATDSFGISSVLADDFDFVNQPLDRHMELLRVAGVKYLVIFSPPVKERLSLQEGVGARHDLGDWSVFELRDDPLPRVRALSYRPALVVSDFSLKQRRKNEYDFVRLAEEQFADGWFDVLLARSPESKLDRLAGLEHFGALVVDTYAYADEDSAFERLKAFARSRPLILLSSPSPLFLRIKAAIGDFQQAEIVEREQGDAGDLIDSEFPTARYGTNPVRKTWRAVRGILDSRKVAVDVSEGTDVKGQVEDRGIEITTGASEVDDLPVAVSTTYHPNWRRDDGDYVYTVTPFYMLTFVRRPTRLVYARRWYDRLGMAASLFALCGLACFTLWPYRTGFHPLIKAAPPKPGTTSDTGRAEAALLQAPPEGRAAVHAAQSSAGR